MADHNCPLYGKRCPYPGPGPNPERQRGTCNGACIDSWYEDENDKGQCYVREGDNWVATDSKPTIPVVTYPLAPAPKPQPGVLPFGRKRKKRR